MTCGMLVIAGGFHAAPVEPPTALERQGRQRDTVTSWGPDWTRWFGAVSSLVSAGSPAPTGRRICATRAPDASTWSRWCSHLPAYQDSVDAHTENSNVNVHRLVNVRGGHWAPCLHRARSSWSSSDSAVMAWAKCCPRSRLLPCPVGRCQRVLLLSNPDDDV